MRALSLVTALLLAACGADEQGAGQGGAPVPEPSSRGPRGPVVAEAIAALEAETAAQAAPAVHPPEDLEERVHGLLASLAGGSSGDSMRRLILEELKQLGSPVVPLLAQRLNDRDAPAAQRNASAEALAALDLPQAAEVLLVKVESSRSDEQPEPWLVAQCAWRLGETGQDQVVPRLALCLRYERDLESVLWLASTLAHFGNFAGLDGLRALTSYPSVASRAEGRLIDLADEHGFETWAELEAAWNGTHASPPPEESFTPRHQLEVWKQIRALADWQLRGVDDGRFVLSRGGVRTAELLARALADENVYIRVHAAQCLERMGPRGATAGPQLMAGLEDPELAPQAAAALGGLRYEPAVDALAERLAPETSLELRVAAARALGHIPAPSTADLLEPLMAETEPIDLRAAAAGALARTAPLERVEPAVRLLVELLESPALEPTEPEAALADFIARRVAEGSQVATTVQGGWVALERGREKERLEGRARLLQDTLDDLLPQNQNRQN